MVYSNDPKCASFRDFLLTTGLMIMCNAKELKRKTVFHTENFPRVVHSHGSLRGWTHLISIKIY